MAPLPPTLGVLLLGVLALAWDLGDAFLVPVSLLSRGGAKVLCSGSEATPALVLARLCLVFLLPFGVPFGEGRSEGAADDVDDEAGNATPTGGGGVFRKLDLPAVADDLGGGLDGAITWDIYRGLGAPRRLTQLARVCGQIMTIMFLCSPCQKCTLINMELADSLSSLSGRRVL